MSDTREKLSTEGIGFGGVKSGTENNTRGTTRVEVGTPGKAQKQMRAMTKSGESHTSRFPLHGAHPKKDKFGDTRNTFHPAHGR